MHRKWQAERVRRRAARCREPQVKTWPRPATDSEPRRWTLFCCELLPRHRPRLDALFGEAVEKLQVKLWHGEIIYAAQLKVLRRGQAREGPPAVEFSTT